MGTMGQGEDYQMMVRTGEQPRLLKFQPAFNLYLITLRTGASCTTPPLHALRDRLEYDCLGPPCGTE
jgi:hypothetical protein